MSHVISLFLSFLRLLLLLPLLSQTHNYYLTDNNIISKLTRELLLSLYLDAPPFILELTAHSVNNEVMKFWGHIIHSDNSRTTQLKPSKVPEKKYIATDGVARRLFSVQYKHHLLTLCKCLTWRG
uniref:Secreted protein n=1 Tax=Cacopsylla melanoneura TaxID=428564 RepID=A0A8D8Z024_9HEMI